MLDKLVESKNSRGENKLVRRLLMATSTFTLSGVIFALVFSLFNQTLAMGSNSIELTTLITPPLITETEPLPPKPKKSTPKKSNALVKSKVPTRVQNILRIDESPTKAPTKISTTPSTAKARPNGKFRTGLKDSGSDDDVFSKAGNDSKASAINDSEQFGRRQPKVEKQTKKKPLKKIAKLPPPPVKKVKKERKTILRTSKVLNGKALRLVKPAYSKTAQQMNLKGKVTVQVTIDENGRVISARAVKGHPLFRRDAVSAAKRSTFSPTYISKQKVKVSGLIVYNFN